MEQTKELVASESVQTLSIPEIHGQIQIIQQLMKTEMQDKEHYGVIPGCGDKPALLKAGAEKLCLLFRMAPRFKVELVDLGDGHREYRITTELYRITDSSFLGEGMGSCSTMETKYRYRGSKAEPTGELVPKEYWADRDVELIGGKNFTTQKVDGKWLICRKGEKTLNPDIADTYNTVLKMAKKRSLVDAVLTATAASDIFTQDIEEFTPEVVQPAPAARASAPAARTISDEMEACLQKLEAIGVERVEVKGYVGRHSELETEEMVIAHLTRILKSLEEAETTVDEVFAVPQGIQEPQRAAHQSPASAHRDVPRGTPKAEIPKERIIQAKFDAPCSACKQIMKKGVQIYKGDDGKFRHLAGAQGVPCR